MLAFYEALISNNKYKIDICQLGKMCLSAAPVQFITRAALDDMLTEKWFVWPLLQLLRLKGHAQFHSC